MIATIGRDRARPPSDACESWERWFRIAVVALSTLVLCACRGPRGDVSQPVDPFMAASAAAADDPSQQRALDAAYEDATVEPQRHNDAIAPVSAESPIASTESEGVGIIPVSYGAMGFAPAPVPCACATGSPCGDGCSNGTCQGDACGAPCGPLGCGPRYDEYLCDGGDEQLPSAVSPDWQLFGLEMEDTIAHYDTLDGRTLIEPSNKVCVYAPRFAAVRMVVGLSENDYVDMPVGLDKPQRALPQQDVRIAVSRMQTEKEILDDLARQPNEFRLRQFDGAVSTVVGPEEFVEAYQPYEGLSVMRTGIYLQSEKAFLAEGVTAAVTWTKDLAVQIILDEKVAVEAIGDRRAQAVFTIDEPNSPKLRLVKVASMQTAQVGDKVDFTLRFDNVGDVPIGNVVIVDNLTTRLEYVDGSAQASRKAEFSTSANEGGSLVLRWELDEPLKPGDGGVLRFQCIVR